MEKKGKRKILSCLIVVIFAFFAVINVDVKAIEVGSTKTVITKKVTARKYKIKYELYGGVNSKKNPSFYTKNTKTIKLSIPTRKGYTFKGWYSNAKLTKKVTTIKKGSTGNKTLYAKWVANSYTVNFNDNGATSGDISNFVAKYGKAYKFPKHNLKKTGYTFGGWTTKKNGTGTVFKKSFKNLASKNKDLVTFYAKWIPNTYTIKFDGNGATSGSMKSLTNRKVGINYKLPKNGFKKKGYVFAGWTINKSGNGIIYYEGDIVKNLTTKNKGVVTLYARWLPPTPTLKRIEKLSYNTMKVVINKVAGVDGYEVFYGENKYGSYKSVRSTSNEIVISNLKGSHIYYFEINSFKNVNGGTVESNSKSYRKRTAAEPKVTGKIVKQTGKSSTLKVYIKNAGNKDMTIKNSSIIIYPDKKLDDFSTATPSKNIIKANSSSYVTFKLNKSKVFANGTNIFFIFTYDNIDYEFFVNDSGQMVLVNSITGLS